MLTVIHVDEQRGLRGGEQQAAWLIEGLCSRGVRNVLLGRPGEEFLSIERDNPSVLRFALPLRGELDAYSARALARLTHQLDADIMHAHTSHAHAIALLSRLLGGRGRLVVSRRVDFVPKRHVLNRWKYKCADRILCVSEKVLQTLRSYGLPRQQLRTVHSSIDFRRVNVPPISRSTLNLPDSCPLVFSAGALVDHKDHANLLEAFSLVAAHLPQARLCIAGDGPLRKELEDKTAALQLSHHVSFLGYRTDAPSITRAANVYVSSSWSEGLGTSILEALAAETPVVATDAGGAAEMVLPQETGRLVPARNPQALAAAILESLQDVAASHAMAAAGRHRVELLFSSEKMIERTLDIYLELLSEGAPPQDAAMPVDP